MIGAGHANVSASASCLSSVEHDGTGCSAARKFLRQLTKSPTTLFGDEELATKAVGVLGLARSVCSFSAASGGADKYAGAARFQARLISAGCELLVPMGTSEVELEGVEAAVLPWADAAARAFEELIARRLETLAGAPAAACAADDGPKTDDHEAGCRAGAADGLAPESSTFDGALLPLPSELLDHKAVHLAAMAGALLSVGAMLVLSLSSGSERRSIHFLGSCAGAVWMQLRRS